MIHTGTEVQLELPSRPSAEYAKQLQDRAEAT